jgi:serine/threonine-protein kinase
MALQDATVADTGVALDATVPSLPKDAVAEPAPAAASTAGRTTVLPRVETVGAQTRVVTDTRRRFEPVQRLGEGGLGEVTGMLDHDIGRKVAMKRLRSEVKSAATALRFAEEVRTVGQLEHPNIVPIHDVGVDESGDYFFLMKYVDGETLESIIEKLAAGDRRYHAEYGFERRVEIFRAILDAVAFAHTKGILHRDIKPANVMVGAYGEVVLMDWGIAKRVAGGTDAGSHASAPSLTASRRGTLFETRTGELVGTPAYSSPEQARGAIIDERSDVYSLALLFHELLCLRHPLEEKKTLPEMLHAVQHEAVPFSSFVSSPHQAPTPAELSWFIHRGVAKDPTKRFQSVSEMIERLERRAEGNFPVQCPVTFAKRVLAAQKRFVDHHPLMTTFLLFSTTVALILAVVRVVHATVR